MMSKAFFIKLTQTASLTCLYYASGQGGAKISFPFDLPPNGPVS